MIFIARELDKVFSVISDLFFNSSSCSNGPKSNKLPCQKYSVVLFALRSGKFSRLGVTHPLPSILPQRFDPAFEYTILKILI